MPTDLARPLQPILDRFDAVRKKIRSLFLFDGLAVVVAFLCLFAFFVPVLDWSLYLVTDDSLPQGVRLVFLAGALGAAGFLVARRILRPMTVPISDDDLAVYVERLHPAVRDRLLAAIQLSRGDPDRDANFNSPELVRLLIERTAADAASLDPGVILHRGTVARRCGAALACALVVGSAAAGTAALAPEHFRAAWQRLIGLNVPWPQRTFVEVRGFQDGRRVVARGDDVEIVAVARGGSPRRARITYEFENGETGSAPMSPGENRGEFVYVFDSVKSGFTISVRAGDGDAGPFLVEALPRPRAETPTMSFVYPAYITAAQIQQLNLPPAGRAVDAANFRNVPVHARITFSATCNVPLRAARIEFGGRGAPQEFEPAVQGAAFSQEVVLLEPQSQLEVSLFAENGLESIDILRFEVRGKEDESPSIDVQSPATAEEAVTARCLYPIDLIARDDYGLSDIHVRWTTSTRTGQPPTDDPTLMPPDIDLSYPAAQIRARPSFNVEPLQLREGDSVTLQFAATDNMAVEDVPPNAPHVTREFRLTIVSEDRLAEELQNKVDEIKRALERTKRDQEVALVTTTRLRQDLGQVDLLTAADRGRVAEVERDELRIRRDLAEARRELDRVRRRGEYNRIFDEGAVRRLSDAIDLLDGLGADPSATTGEFPTIVGAHAIGEASRVNQAGERRRHLLIAEEQETIVVSTLADVLDLLSRWTSYQEIVRRLKQWIATQQQIQEWVRTFWGNP